jgi:hypothetical protein
MTEILVATRDGVLTAPGGEKFRLHRGRTLADARHPAAVAYPDNFMPMQVELSVEDDAPTPEDLGTELSMCEAERDGFRSQLAAIADGVASRGLLPDDLDTSVEGWLATLVLGLLDTAVVALSADGHTMDREISPPAGAVRRPRKTAARGVGADDA